MWRISGEKLSSCSEIFICNLDADATDSVGIEPIHLDKVLILDVCRNACCLQSSAKEVRLLGLAERGDCFHEYLAGPNEGEINHGSGVVANTLDLSGNEVICSSIGWMRRLKPPLALSS